MDEPRLRIGVIGAGAAAQVAHLPALRGLGGVEVLALSDTDEQKLRQVSQRYGIRRVFVDFEDLLRVEEIEGVVVATPNYLHAPMSIAALNYGKHVLCERPMAMNPRDAREMVKAARESARTLLIGFNQRYRPDVRVLRTFVKKGELGEILYVKTGWLRRRTDWPEGSWMMRAHSAGGGVFLDLGVQMLDLALWVCGYPQVLAVSAVTNRRGKGYDVEDSGSAFLRLSGKAVLSLEVSWTLVFDKDLTYVNFLGNRGAAALNPLRIHKELYGQLVNVTPVMKLPSNLHKASYEAQAAHFVECMRGRQEPAIPAEECLRTTEVLQAIYRSAELGEEVKMPDETTTGGRNS
jgi:predicted dehydrogenase